jgi:hypothetical protein
MSGADAMRLAKWAYGDDADAVDCPSRPYNDRCSLRIRGQEIAKAASWEFIFASEINRLRSA